RPAASLTPETTREDPGRHALDDQRRGQEGGEPPVVNLAITGANSGVGNILLRHLAGRTDIQVVACVRSAGAAAALHAAPGISVRQVDYDDRDRLTAALQGAACAVQLAGILFESASSTYQSANVDATQAVVDACRKAG